MIGEKYHPGALVEPLFGDGVEDFPQGRVGDLDGTVELGDIPPDLRSVGKIRRHLHRVRVDGPIPFRGIGAVRLEEARGEQKRFGRVPHATNSRPARSRISQ